MAAFRLHGLNLTEFSEFFTWDDAALAARQMQRVVATSASGFPCRVSLVDAGVGEDLLLLSYQHQSADSPYRAAGPIFVRRGAVAAALAVDEVPRQILRRLMSLRAYDAGHRIIAAEVCEGEDVAAWLASRFEEASVAYIHLHFARYGCYACRADRACAG